VGLQDPLVGHALLMDALEDTLYYSIR
jgi:hypothetical protein